jgi:HlyD family secretion protein
MRAPKITSTLGTYPMTDEISIPNAIREPGRRGLFMVLPSLASPLLFLSLLFLPLLMACDGAESDAIRASGTVEATEAALGFQLAGRIAWIGVREGASVMAGEEVARLDQDELHARYRGADAAVAQAEAARGQVEAALANAVVTVPFPGVVTLRHREPGETVAPGFPVLTVMDPEDRWVRIYVREDRIGAVALGQQAAITADTYPDRRYAGEVVFISSRAEFTPRNVQTAEERVRLVYAVKVRITGDPEHDLKPGIPADVVLEPRAGGVSR